MIDKGEEFMWYLYLEATMSEPIPDVMFQHVEKVIQNGITVGMALEVPVKTENDEERYWVAKVTMVCGPLLELQYYGCEGKNKIWFNLTKETGHELGWCYKNDKKLAPPTNHIVSLSHIEKLEHYIKNTVSVPSDMLLGESINLMTRIKAGMKVDISDPLNPYKLWMATIIQNVGGRLLLRYDTPGSPVKNFWIFCTSELIHDYGFAKLSSSPWFLDPPFSIKSNHSSDEWIDFVKSYLLNNRSDNLLFKNEETHFKHEFKVGMKLEALSPKNKSSFCPATVTNVIDDKYFLVTIDEFMKDSHRNADSWNNTDKTWLCTVNHPYIFPKNWAKRNGIMLSLPSGWVNSSDYFDWDKYLKETNAIAADESLFYKRDSVKGLSYECGMRLEAVNPLNEDEICAAQVLRIIDDLLFVKLSSEYDQPEFVYHIRSTQIFPVGWCETNQYPLKPPKDYREIFRKHRKFKAEGRSVTERGTSLTKIYFNSRCSTGPMISKSKLTTLPKSVGPGPVDLVLKEVLTMLVSVGYNSARVLKVLQCDTPLDAGYNLEMLKVKQKNNRYHASVAVVNDCELVEEFCRNICKKIMVCPNLFGPTHITDKDQCPEKCRKSRGRGKWIRKRGRQPNKDKNTSTNGERENEREDESSASDNSQNPPDEENKTATKSIKNKLLDNSDDIKNEVITSDTSESSNNDRLKRKESNGDSSSTKSLSSKDNVSPNSKTIKRKRDIENNSDLNNFDYAEPEYKPMHKQRKIKLLQLDSNPLNWSIEEVYNFLKRTSNCKDIAHIVKREEIDGMAFLLINYPSLIHHMKLSEKDALKLCRHVEQVKLTFFLKFCTGTIPDF